jgi:drug/metabolite transporter (DMT)-like permease
MYIGYGLALITIAVLTCLLFLLTPWHLRTSIIVGILLFLPLAPFLTYMARVLWIYLDQSIDPDRSS